MTKTVYAETWDLDVFFPGGSKSEEFKQYIEELKGKVQSFSDQVKTLEVSGGASETKGLEGVLQAFSKVAYSMRQAGAFISCLTAQDTTDDKAVEWRGTLTNLSASFQTSLTTLDQRLTQYEDGVWEELLKKAPFTEIAFVLDERRQKAKEKLSLEQESLINSLSVDGYHGWGQFYDQIVKNIQIPFKENGETKLLSVGQASNKFSNGDREVRKQVFEDWEKAWADQGDYLSNTLNHLAGFRLQVYKHRGWEEVLKEPLSINRMEKKTLDAMWESIVEHKKHLVKYLERKAELLGVEKLNWYDLNAPIGSSESSVTYQEGADFIIENFKDFGEELTAFTQKAFEDRWIEAEDRPGKRPGGFCTGFPESGQSRIFMTFSGTPSNVSTLAHELGHAFHSYAMKDVHPLNKSYAMNVAETASTFAEAIVSDASVKTASTHEEKLALLEDKLQRSVALLMNIHARFLFETRFYEERKNGNVSYNRLNEIMLEAQKEAYCDSLGEYHPLFWASKLHFYITGVPFYNFPYTFGFLFSMGIYQRALEEGQGFEQKYIALLKDTASMTVEDLAKKHLNVDLTEKDFWEDAIKPVVKDVEDFLEMTK
ncbi:M3 family oligoendopeptidase [Bacillus carboniphilus]|uniref:M3 family oligoendopeptidase n=1 Tax=Bacillus carboniphilus TaxID=86663 RepID=A0ABN0WLV1_9BACI